MLNKQRMLIIAHNMSPSGVPMVYMSIVRSLNDKYTFDLLLTDGNDMYYKDEFISYGGNIYINQIKKPKNLLERLFWYSFSYNHSTKKYIKQNIDLKKYTAIHSFEEVFSFPYFNEAKKAGVKNRIIHICSAFRAYKLNPNLKTKLLELYRKKELSLCTAIACSSEQTLTFNNYKGRGVVLHRRLDVEKIGQKHDCEHNNLCLMQIGSFSDRKNQLFSLEVLDCLKKIIPTTKLIFVGDELQKTYKDKMIEFINKNGLNGNVEFMGSTPDRDKLNRIVSYSLYPSTMESFGNVMIESQAVGIRCFASDTLPRTANLGNISYLPLDAQVWCNQILDFYRKNGNIRIDPIGIERFSEEQFRSTVLQISTKY